MKPGDGFALSFDNAARKILSIAVKSDLDYPKDDIVILNIFFAALPERLNNLSECLLNANSAYRRLS